MSGCKVGDGSAALSEPPLMHRPGHRGAFWACEFGVATFQLCSVSYGGQEAGGMEDKATSHTLWPRGRTRAFAWLPVTTNKSSKCPHGNGA